MSRQTRELIEELYKDARTALMLFKVSGQVWYKDEACKALNRAREAYRVDLEDQTLSFYTGSRTILIKEAA